MRVLIEDDPFCAGDADKPWGKKGDWPCFWVGCAGSSGPVPFVVAYRKRFTLTEGATIRVHVSADERYELFLDGTRVGRGSERGDAFHWYFETYDLDVSAGEHALVARVWAQGTEAPFAQMSVQPGFILAPQEPAFLELLGTGIAEWEAKRLGGYAFVSPLAAWGTGQNLIVDGSAFDWGFETGAGDGWQPVVKLAAGADAKRKNEGDPFLHRMLPATLPPMLDEPRHVGTVRLVADIPALETHAIPVRAADNLADEQAAWQQLIHGIGSVTVPPHTRRRVLLDLDDYYCAYPDLLVSGGQGGTVRVHWQESLFNEHETKTKGDRNAIEDKFFVTIWWRKDGIGDTFLPDGGQNRRFETLWWQCGRYVEIAIETQEDPLTLNRFTLRETRYPLEDESAFAASDVRLAEVTPMAVRTLQMCAHETYMDCPYYEQLMYIGDTRLQALITYAISRDDRLPRKALAMFDASRQLSGLTQSRYPTRVRQMIPPFSLWHIGMVHDFARWRDDPAFVRALMPGVRGISDHFLALRDETHGLVKAPEGWNTLDWVPEWEAGVPPDGHAGISGVINGQLALTLTQAAALETLMGEPELAGRARRAAYEIMESLGVYFWDEERGLYADDLEKTRFSEHTQCFALLSGLLEPDRRERVALGLLTAPDLSRATIYFSHYLFETYRILGRTDALLERMALWFDLRARGLKTTVEMPEPTRSDCHAWGAHPVYHYFATILGIRPAEWGFQSVEIAPQLGPLEWARGTMRHPRGGEIRADLRQTAETGVIEGSITLPEGVSGVLRFGGNTLDLIPGEQAVRLETATVEATRGPQLQMLWPERLVDTPPPAPALPEDYRLRAYADSDEAAYAALMDQAGFTGWDAERIRSARRALLPGGFFVIEHVPTGRIVATAMAAHRPSEQHPEGAELSWVAADVEHRGKGLGRAVVAAATARMLAAGYRRIFLLTDDFRLPALKVYLDLGYEPHLVADGMAERWKRVYEALSWTPRGNEGAA